MALPLAEVENIFAEVNDDIDYASMIVPPRGNNCLKCGNALSNMIKGNLTIGSLMSWHLNETKIMDDLNLKRAAIDMRFMDPNLRNTRETTLHLRLADPHLLNIGQMLVGLSTPAFALSLVDWHLLNT
ncbi:hypothetical protein HAX54_027775 [Datura stramonium]|uniref:Uncharacterized protein n=1 Tax=Datura stramonium TaxID=4076 RepID=A0ABS8S907_DATST|nr:hypothetical protein [Datura stramonium]